MRIHFSAADMGRITIARQPDVLLETVLGLRRLRSGTPAAPSARPGLARWRQDMRTVRPRAGVLLDLVPSAGFLPDFLHQPDARDFTTALDLVTGAPAERLALDLGLADEHGLNGFPDRPSRWVRELARGSSQARRTLHRDLKEYFTYSTASLWPRIRADALADRAVRAETLLRGGVDALLTTLSPTWSWQAPVLSLPSRARYDIPLCGNGLLLVPSWFATGALVVYRPDRPTTLVYPMTASEAHALSSSDVLSPLLGRTRAAVLLALRTPATTTALAERVGISLATASQHASVLRAAGLVGTTRTGQSVLHSPTPLGLALLEGESAPR
ncbi:ArsR/SmtB family transcription factor [Streptomyces sp. NPDC001914]|uniref:ArsR/SmtB family transcription factor n=1 Tax=Streptomyces sp. NPDC001914 TaxID=3364623 RepID=UPI0036AB7ABD